MNILNMLMNNDISLIQCFLPDTMMVTTIAPIIIYKYGDLSDYSHYIPIALATVASKRFELLILSRATPVLTTYANQFGFKK